MKSTLTSREPPTRGAAGCCVVSHDLSAASLATDLGILATLGNETRYETLRLIAAADRPVCVCELEPALSVTQGAVSQALSRLHEANLVTRQKRGRWRYYTPTHRAERILRALDENRRIDDD